MGSSTRSRGSRNMSGRWAVDCTRTSAYAENGGYIQYIIYIYIQRFLESRWIYLWAVTCCLVLLSFFIYREVCASETCKGPCKIASEFQVSRWRAAELQIAQKERKKERMTCCFWTCWCSAAIVLQVSRGHTIYPRIGGRACKITGKLKFIFLGASYIWYKQVYCACSYSGTSLR